MNNTFALITGASAGIGKAIAFEMAHRKIHLLLVALPDSGLEIVRDELVARYGIRCYSFAADLTDPVAPSQLEAWCRSQRYNVRYLINNAGFGNQCALENSDPRILVSMMTLNNQAMVSMTQRFIPILKKNKSAHLMNVASLASFLPIPNKSVYAGTKSFVYAFSSALRVELSRYGIKVSCLCPGPTLTNEANNGRLKGVSGSRWFTQQPRQVAEEAVAKMLMGKRRIIPGLASKFLFGLWRILPADMVDWILQRLFDKSDRKNYGTILSEFPSNPRLLALAFR